MHVLPLNKVTFLFHFSSRPLSDCHKDDGILYTPLCCRVVLCP
jgi:hypothetical protein